MRQNSGLVGLHEDLVKETKKAVRARGKGLTWLRFAKKTKSGYRFLSHKEAQWQLLEEIAKKVAPRHPDYPLGQVVDILCELVN